MPRYTKKDYELVADVIGAGDCAYGARAQVLFILETFYRDNPRFDGIRFIKRAMRSQSDCYDDELLDAWSNLKGDKDGE